MHSLFPLYRTSRNDCFSLLLKQAVNTLARELCYLVDYGSGGSRYAVMITGGGNQQSKKLVYVWAVILPFIAP